MIPALNPGPAEEPYDDHNASGRVILYYARLADHFQKLAAEEQHPDYEYTATHDIIVRAGEAEFNDPTPTDMTHFTPVDRIGLWNLWS